VIRRALRSTAKGAIYTTVGTAAIYTLAYLWWRSMCDLAAASQPSDPEP
jgi:hypothetical protein